MIDILIVLDRSGSMQDARSDHEGGIKSFIESQRKLAGDVKLTLVQFDSVSPCEVVYDRADLKDVKDIHLVPRGWTPLNEAVGRALAHLMDKQGADGGDTVVMVVTDGRENCSHHEWTKARVKSLVEERTKAGWRILFLGANIDAFQEGNGLGVSSVNSMNFKNSKESVRALYATTGDRVLMARSTRAKGSAAPMSSMAVLNYSSDDRASVMGAEQPKEEQDGSSNKQ